MVYGKESGATAVKPRLSMGQFAINHSLRANGRAESKCVHTGPCSRRKIAEAPRGGEETALAGIDIGEADPPIVGVRCNRGTIRVITTWNASRSDMIGRFADHSAC